VDEEEEDLLAVFARLREHFLDHVGDFWGYPRVG
jgi:hypothetical protein